MYVLKGMFVNNQVHQSDSKTYYHIYHLLTYDQIPQRQLDSLNLAHEEIIGDHQFHHITVNIVTFQLNPMN